MQIYTVESLSGRSIEEGELIFANAILAANFLRDVREAITNALGGNMRRYESVLERVTEQALGRLKQKAADLGYDGVAGVRMTSPYMIQGSAAITVYGTGFRFPGTAKEA